MICLSVAHGGEAALKTARGHSCPQQPARTQRPWSFAMVTSLRTRMSARHKDLRGTFSLCAFCAFLRLLECFFRATRFQPGSEARHKCRGYKNPCSSTLRSTFHEGRAYSQPHASCRYRKQMQACYGGRVRGLQRSCSLVSKRPHKRLQLLQMRFQVFPIVPPPAHRRLEHRFRHVCIRG